MCWTSFHWKICLQKLKWNLFFIYGWFEPKFHNQQICFLEVTFDEVPRAETEQCAVPELSVSFKTGLSEEG